MKTTLPPDLEAKLTDFRRRVWIVKLAEGILAAVFGLGLSYLLVFVLDRFWETPAWVRFCILLAGASTLGLGVPLKWHRWVWRQRRLEDVARLLRLTFPRLGDQLLGMVELVRREEGTSGRSERLVQAAIAQTAESVKDRDFSGAVPKARHRQWALAAASVLGLAALAFATVSPAARNAFIRWLEPWRNVERFTFVDVEPLPASIVVPYAEPFDVPVRLKPQTQWSPGEGYGRIGDQSPVKAKLVSDGYTFVFPPQKQEARASLFLGDARENVMVEPKTRPELSEIKAHLRLPVYLGYQTEPIVEVRDGTVGVVKGAQAAFEIEAVRKIASATMDDQPQKLEDGKIVTGYELVASDVNRQVNWKDGDGLTPREPLVLQVKAIDDAPPTIVARRESLEEVVLDSEVVTFDLTATDDFGVKQVGLAWVGSLNQEDEKTPVRGEKVAAAGAPEKNELEVPATFCATREGVAPQTLEIRAWVDDYLPGRPHVRSAVFILHVLNKTDHALWLTEQFGKWLEVAKETYEREQQLNQSNKDLRALSAADLDRPENRRRVSQQAAAENDNASRLTSLTESGRSLVEQATKNDEFDATRLETWATMLKALKDIAANRMPGVSDLLRQTASAPAGNSAMPNPVPPTARPPSPPFSAPPNARTFAGLNQGSAQPKPFSPGAPVDPNAQPKPPAPSITDNEPGFLKASAPKPLDPNAKPQAPSAGKLDLPVTTLAAAPDTSKSNDQPPASPAQQTMGTAVSQQNDLLAEFAKVSGSLDDILTSLEASTFVRRFKAASKEQMTLASNIDQKTLDAFGIADSPLPAAEPIAQKARAESQVVETIQSDLDAYFERKQDARFKTTLDEMKKSEIGSALAGDGEKVSYNLSGQAMSGSEFWADTLDRWAEEMVAASHCKASSSCSGDSLPPEIVLKVMQSLRDEMKLRDETRESENAKPAIPPEKYTADATNLGQTQMDIGTRTASAMTDILALPDGGTKFGKDIQLLKDVCSVMDETHGILVTPDTGPHAIGAETEAIELLLQSKRSGSKGGGGGGANPGGGGTAPSASEAALADLGPGSDDHSVVAARPVGQATGVAGKAFPDEFKSGLDSYFSNLERQSAGR
jgi:hypothetical protein